MNVMTAQKPFEEIQEMLKDAQRIYLVGCGTCATICHTGGKSEVLAMKSKLEEAGKTVTGWMVIPTACDNMTREAIAENIEALEQADCILVLSCAFGVQTVSSYSDRLTYPALDTLFMGLEDAPGHFSEVCIQCGQCILGMTAAICPLTACSKGLLNGPCGGYKHGMCEVDPERECGWVQIYHRLKKLGQIEKLSASQPLKDYSKMTRPRRFNLVAR